jgi:leucyl aminopeptidase
MLSGWRVARRREHAGRIGKDMGKPMSESVKIDFVALTSLAAPASKRSGKGKAAASQTLVVFAGQDLALGKATRSALGVEGEALLKKAAGAGKFKGKGSTALDVIAPSGLSTDRLLVIGTGGEEATKRKGKEEPKPDDYLALGGFVLGKLGAGASATIVFDLPRPPKEVAAAAAAFA